MPKLANPYRSLADVEPGILFLAVRDQRPATIALVLTQVPEAMAVEIAGKLGTEVRAGVLRRLASQQHFRSQIIAEVVEEIQARVSEIERSVGSALAAKILRECEPSLEMTLLQSLDRKDSKVATQIRQTLLTFEDIAWFPDHRIQNLLKNVDLGTWAMAMKRSNVAIGQKVTRNLSQRANELLREESDYLGTATDEEIEWARQRIVTIARTCTASPIGKKPKMAA